MTDDMFGSTAAVELVIEGRIAVGLDSPQDLAVDLATNLAVDSEVNLSVFSGVIWDGFTAIQTVAAQGVASCFSGDPQ